jgi:hypothetical protein
VESRLRRSGNQQPREPHHLTLNPRELRRAFDTQNLYMRDILLHGATGTSRKSDSFPSLNLIVRDRRASNGDYLMVGHDLLDVIAEGVSE